MKIFLIICLILHVIGIIFKIGNMVWTYRENEDGLFRYMFYSLPFSLVILVGLILSVIYI